MDSNCTCLEDEYRTWTDCPTHSIPNSRVGCKIPIENPITLEKLESYLEDMWEAHIKWLYNYNKRYGTNFELKKKNLKVHTMYDLPTDSIELHSLYRISDLIRGNEAL